MRYAERSGRFAVAQSIMVPMSVPYEPRVSIDVFFILSDRSTDKGRAQMKHGQEQTTILCRTTFLDVQLGEGHEVAVGQPDKKSTDVQRPNMSRSHHDDVRYCAKNASHPKTHLPSKLCGNETRETGAYEGAHRHQGRDKLLSSGVNVPSDCDFGVSVAIDLIKSDDQYKARMLVKQHAIQLPTFRKPGMACNPPINPKSRPYWKGERTMIPHAAKHRQWARMVSCDWSAMMKSQMK